MSHSIIIFDFTGSEDDAYNRRPSRPSSRQGEGRSSSRPSSRQGHPDMSGMDRGQEFADRGHGREYGEEGRTSRPSSRQGQSQRRGQNERRDRSAQRYDSRTDPYDYYYRQDYDRRNSRQYGVCPQSSIFSVGLTSVA